MVSMGPGIPPYSTSSLVKPWRKKQLCAWYPGKKMLVGGFNSFEIYTRQFGSFPTFRAENKKMLETTTWESAHHGRFPKTMGPGQG